MRFHPCLLFLFLFFSSLSPGGEPLPTWLAEQLSDPTVIAKPGVYALKDSRLLGVGQGKVHESLRDTRGQRTALNSAEHDAKQRIAQYIHPEIFKKYKTVAVEIGHVARVFERPPTPGNSLAYVGLVADPADVTVVPVLDASVILGAEKVVVAPEMFGYLEDPLLQMGGGRIFSRDAGWIVVGVGVAPLFGDDSVAERDAMKRARLEAGKAIAEAVFGSSFEVLEQEAESQIERDGIINMRQWASRRTRESIEGELQHAEEVGHWLTDDNHVAVVIAVSNQPLNASMQFGVSQTGDIPEMPEYPDWEVTPQWEYVLFSRPRLLKGGAIIYPDPDGIWAVGVGAAKLTGNPAHDQMNAPRAAEMDARRNIIKYLSGFSTQSNTEEIEEVAVIFAENGLKSSSVVESLQKTTREKASGLVRGLRKVGSWKSMDRKLLYQVLIVELKELNS